MDDTKRPATMRDHWQAAQNYLRSMMDFSAYELWVATLEPQGYANGVLTLAASSAAQRDRAAVRLDRVIRNALWLQTGREVTVEYVLATAETGGAPC